MYVRSGWTASLVPAQDVVFGLGELATSDQALLRQLHALALSIYQAQQDILAAQARGDTSYVQARLQDLVRLRGLFNDTAALLQTNDTDVLGPVDSIILTVGTWIESSLHALPGAIAALPNAFLDAVNQIGVKVGSTATGIAVSWLVPVALVGGALIVLARKAERTRTYRRYVA